MDTILASSSPRRKELLSLIIPRFEVVEPDIIEEYPEFIPILEVAEFLAVRKATSVAEHYNKAVIIGCDTTVIIDGIILGKPVNDDDATRMLTLLSGRTHIVTTGVCFWCKGDTYSFSQSTDVTFYELTPREIFRYVRTGEPYDKAGGYAIQGVGGSFVKEIKGDYFSVVGLPIGRVKRELDDFLG